MKMGLWWIKLVVLGMKDIRKYVIQVSCDQSGGQAKSSLSLTGGEGGGSEEGLNLLTRYLNSPLLRLLRWPTFLFTPIYCHSYLLLAAASDS